MNLTSIMFINLWLCIGIYWSGCEGEQQWTCSQILRAPGSGLWTSPQKTCGLFLWVHHFFAVGVLSLFWFPFTLKRSTTIGVRAKTKFAAVLFRTFFVYYYFWLMVDRSCKIFLDWTAIFRPAAQIITAAQWITFEDNRKSSCNKNKMVDAKEKHQF